MEDVLEDDRKCPFTVAFISTYKNMGELFENIAQENNVKAYIEIASLDEAAKIANQLKDQVDVFLSRGGTAEYIKNSVDIPVVSIPVTTFDIMRAMYSAKEITSDIALFTYEKAIFGKMDIEEMLKVKIHEFTFQSENDIELNMERVKDKGIKAMVGGAPAVKIAEKYGIKGILLECGEEAIQQSLIEALSIAEVRNTELERSARLRVILDSITQGIIVTNESNKIEVCNPAAERILNISTDKALGKRVLDILPNTRMHKVFESGEAEIGELQDVNGGVIAINRIPVEADGRRIGVVSTFEDVTKIQKLEQKIREKMNKKGFIAKHCFDDILTINKDMIELKKLANLYAKTDGAILIQGESGTGKELFAQSIHNASKRSNGPFVAVNCAAIPENLLESELFGYEGGAFSGARKEGKQGLFELAHNGTVFLDEVGEIAKGLQARLLRVLQEKEIMRVGGDRIIPVDIRIISATNQELQKQIENGEFRQDLYYRLNVFNIQLPPLRDHKEDIELLTSRLLRKFAGDAIDIDRAVKETKELLMSYDWSGNIRELNNVVERLSLVFIQNSPDKWTEMLEKVMYTSRPEEDYISVKVNMKYGLKHAIKDVERDIINSMLLKYNQDKEKVIEELKIGRATFWRKI